MLPNSISVHSRLCIDEIEPAFKNHKMAERAVKRQRQLSDGDESEGTDDWLADGMRMNGR